MLSLYRPDNPANEYKIFTYVKGFPIDLSAVLVVLHVAGMLACTVAYAVKPSWIGLFICTPQSLFGGRFWQFATYPFIHNIALEHIWFVISMVMLIWFGRPVESTIGTLTFGLMYAVCAILPAALIILAGLPGAEFAGSTTLHFAVFIAFALLFPDAQIFFGVQAKWIAIIFLAIDTLACLAQHWWVMLLLLWLSAAVVYSYLRFIHARGVLTRFIQRFSRPPSQGKRETVRPPQPLRGSNDIPESGSERIMDTLLRKISENGIDSLSPKEQRQLEDARRKIIDKKKQR